jgi:hypothetical protein
LDDAPSLGILDARVAGVAGRDLHLVQEENVGVAAGLFYALGELLGQDGAITIFPGAGTQDQDSWSL